MKTGIELITEERKEQIEKHGYNIQHNLYENDDDQLAYAGSILAYPDLSLLESEDYRPKDWEKERWEKMWNKSHPERLIIAGALIVAEIDRRNKSEN